MTYKSICVLGLGYIGLPTAAMFASRGVSVVGVDISQDVVDIINKGEIHIVEPELAGLVYSSVSKGTLMATTIPEPADAYLIAVPTPFKASKNSDQEPDLKFIESAVRSIGPILKQGDLVILESTSPVGTTELVASWLADAREDLTFPSQTNNKPDVNVAHCPERVLPGHIVRELVENDRIIGGITQNCSMRAKELYEIFVEGDCIITNARTAEMAKLTENSCRDVQIAFANELSMICDEQDINVWELIELANRHPRINILKPGPGVGGHCIAVDPWFIVSRSPQHAKLIRTARQINDYKPKWVEEKINTLVLDLKGANDSWPEIRFWGLAFKADIDDLRESPALKIVENFCNFYQGVIKVIEPNISTVPRTISSKAQLFDTKSVSFDMGVDVILVDHKEFLDLDFGASVIDTRGILEAKC